VTTPPPRRRPVLLTLIAPGQRRAADMTDLRYEGETRLFKIPFRNQDGELTTLTSKVQAGTVAAV